VYEIYKEVRFEAAHQIVGHVDPETGGPGKCSRLHGHSYRIGFTLRADRLLPIGFMIDYYVLGLALKEVREAWDHRFLNECIEFMNVNTTAENIAFLASRKIWYCLSSVDQSSLVHVGARLHMVEVHETESTFARYYPKGGECGN
jgi:6-pyruvoyltetrahydropterin/6-carboxytetrahydropterin synthase